MDIGNLASGLIGAIIGSVIGAIATYFAAIKGAKTSIEETVKVESKKQRQLDKNLEEQIIQSLREELEHNLQLASNSTIGSAKVRFLDKAFEMASASARLLPKEILTNLRPVYVEVWRFNILANYDQEKVPWGLGSLDEALKRQAEVVKAKIGDANKTLKNYKHND